MKYPEWKHELPSRPHMLYNEPLMILAAFYKEHLRRDVDAERLTPPDFWLLIRGLLASAMQTYAAICILLADKQPKPLMLQAAILSRCLLETLGNILALCEAPKARTRVFLRDDYKNSALTYQRYRARFGRDPKWGEYLDVYARGLAHTAKQLRLSRRCVKDPRDIPDQWPTPGIMVYGNPRRNLPPFLRGNRRATFREVYEFHYGPQSEQAHQRAAAVGVALLVDKPDLQWNPGHGESQIVATSILFLTCIVSEIEHTGRYPGHSKLRELWVYLRELDDEAKELWSIRYRKILGASRFS